LYISQYKIRDFFFLVFRCDASFVGGDRVQVLEKNHNGVKIFLKSNQNFFFTSAISREINFGIRNTGNLHKRTLTTVLLKKNREIVGLLEFK